MAYKVIRELLLSINNLGNVYMVEGNHDRITSNKEGNNRKGIVEVICKFLAENGFSNIYYHPFLLTSEIDNIYHICTHGDWKMWKTGYDKFFFHYGKQGVYNVLKTGHYHGFNIIHQTPELLHYQCPSIFSGNLFSESLGYVSQPAFTLITAKNGLPVISNIPLGSFKFVNTQNVNYKVSSI